MGKKHVVEPPKQPIVVEEFDFDEIGDNAKLVAQCARALNHSLRKKMLESLQENTQMMVTEMYIKLRLEQSVASQHLAILRRIKVVETERQGKHIYYRIKKDSLRLVAKQIKQMADKMLEKDETLL
jgi:ArsR family transcriptional regulator, virulence genes transcriptional regulator